MASPAEAAEPQYTTDEKANFAFVRVSCHVPKLKVSRKFKTKGIVPKFSKEPDNAMVDFKCDEKSFTLHIKGKETNDLGGKKYELVVKQLPKLIKADDSYFSVKEERVVVWLKKLTEESWYPELEEGLDVYEEPTEEDQPAQKTDISESDKG